MLHHRQKPSGWSAERGSLPRDTCLPLFGLLVEDKVVAKEASKATLHTPFSFTPQPLQIKSVVAPEHVKGYIYVEAYKQTHVKQAIEGVGNLRMGYWNQQMVPIKEMTDVLKVVKEVTNLKPKSWVRLKRGIYKDDIAQVSCCCGWVSCKNLRRALLLLLLLDQAKGGLP